MVIKRICSVQVSVKEMHTVGLARSGKAVVQGRLQPGELYTEERTVTYRGATLPIVSHADGPHPLHSAVGGGVLLK